MWVGRELLTQREKEGDCAWCLRGGGVGREERFYWVSEMYSGKLGKERQRKR